MKRLKTWTFLVIVILGTSWWINPDLLADLGLVQNDSRRIQKAFSQRISNIIVEANARVTLLLPEQTDGTNTYQQFRIELENGHSLMISHDLDVSLPVPLNVGRKIRFRGEYDWNERGGVVHWTHGDPSGRREGGWIEYDGRIYR